jgi:hypothetical protein
MEIIQGGSNQTRQPYGAFTDSGRLKKSKRAKLQHDDHWGKPSLEIFKGSERILFCPGNRWAWGESVKSRKEELISKLAPARERAARLPTTQIFVASCDFFRQNAFCGVDEGVE